MDRYSTLAPTWIFLIDSLFLIDFSLFLIIPPARCYAGTDGALEYTLYEELPAQTWVGDVKHDSNLTLKYQERESLLLRFSFRQSTPVSRQFTIDERRGVIHTARAVDRDAICPFSLTCDLVLDVAVKPLQYFQIIKVVVRLIDTNDNAPRFPEERIAVSISETAVPGALFPLPTADDADSGLLGVQEYQLLTDFDAFELRVSDQADGSKDVRLRLVSSLDRESVDYYYVTVIALDGGRPPRSGSVFVDIVVLDSNDNNPQFDNSTYEVSVLETVPVSSSLVRVHATDQDQGDNGVVVYSFADSTAVSHRDTFGIDNRTGLIYLKGGLDYERTSTFHLTVKATDKGSNSFPVYAKVVVHVLDVNDNSPQITVNVLTVSGVAEVPENADPGAFVAHLAVKDGDDVGTSGRVDCSIDNRDLFRLEPLFPSEYKITAAVTFDREAQNSYVVTVTCRDSGQPPLTTSQRIDVLVTDENDHSPLIGFARYEVSLPEGNPPGAFVVKINATDEDHGRNRALHYRLEAVDPASVTEGVLSIHLITGRVTANVVFDYEDRRDYAFLVTVTDLGDEPRSATASLFLTIVDVNDERPVFERSVYQFATRENLPIGTVVGRVTATDRDASSDFKRVEYGFRVASDAFEVDRTSGEIVNVRRLDREEENEYRLWVNVFDRGGVGGVGRGRHSTVEGMADGAGETTTVNVTVSIDDENDNSPTFLFPTKFLKTVEISGISSANVGSLVTRIAASDPDSIETGNGIVRYEIANGNEDDTFELDASTGVLTIRKSPVRDGDAGEGVGGAARNRVFNLVVVARDGGSPPRANVADLIVLVNNSVLPNFAAHATGGGSGSATATLEGNAVIILVGALLGSLLVIVCLVLLVVCFLRRRRRAQKIAAAAIVSCQQMRPLSASTSRIKDSSRSLNTVVNDIGSVVSLECRGGQTTTAMMMTTGSSCRYCSRDRCNNRVNNSVLDTEEEEEEDGDGGGGGSGGDEYAERIPNNWPLRNAASLRSNKELHNTDTGVHSAHLKPPYSDDWPSKERRDRTCCRHHQQQQQQQQHYHHHNHHRRQPPPPPPPTPSQQQQQQQQQRRCCCSSTKQTGRRNYSERLNRTMNATCRSNQRDNNDDESVSACSCADSGRGPSEEDDLHHMVAAAAAAAAALKTSAAETSSAQLEPLLAAAASRTDPILR